jgi:hypothetical protein
MSGWDFAKAIKSYEIFQVIQKSVALNLIEFVLLC